MRWWVYLLIFIVSQLSGGLIIVLLQSWLDLGYQVSIVSALLLTNVLAIVATMQLRPVRLSRAADWRWFSTLAVVMAPPAILLVNIVQELLPELPSFVDDESLSQLIRHPLGIATLAVVGPVAEELMFRAGVLGDFLRRHKSGWQSILLSAFLFALAHLNPIQMPAAFILGLLLGWAYWRTGSLWAPIAIHVMNNSLAVAIGLIYDNPDTTLTDVLGPVVTCFVVVFSAMWLGACAYQAKSHSEQVEA